jgi:hypothetical protein
MDLEKLFGLRRWPRAAGLRDVMLCVCDHFEPFHGTDKRGALANVQHWREEFPKFAAAFRDADDRPPAHTFFYPIEQYDADVIRSVADLCHATGSEVEVHLHHDRDSRANLQAVIELGKERLAGHGLLSVDPNGRTRYGFIHGDWALDNSHPGGFGCGVSDELSILEESGCFADFTMPSAPHQTQTRTINSLYYALCTPEPKSHDRGVQARVMPGFRNGSRRSPPLFGSLLLVQGPLALNWHRRKLGILPRIENGDLTPANPPSVERFRLWLDLGISVLGRPEWIFIKLHTHGGVRQNYKMLLGEPMRRFHQALSEQYGDGRNLRLHYVSARELVNILHAAEDGKSGNPCEYRDYVYQRNLTASKRQ